MDPNILLAPDIPYETFKAHNFVEEGYRDFKCKNCEVILYRHNGTGFLYYTFLTKFRNKKCNEILMENVLE